MTRRKTRTVMAGNVAIGGDFPVSVQSMTTADPHDYETVCAQILSLQNAGADIVRLTVPDEESSGVFSCAKERGVTAALVADIHFDYKCALAAVRSGADKIRINPGNIGAEWKIKEVAEACKSGGIPIRIGVNGGSLDRAILEKYKAPTPQALAESAFCQAEMLEKLAMRDIVISIKSSDVEVMTSAVRLVAESSDYPVHIGVTEAGDEYSGIVKNSIGIGSLLLSGIGDTIRVSLTADPVREIKAGREILAALGMNKEGINVISCPTCGRTRIDIIGLVERYKKEIESIDTNKKKLCVAIMGCAVNGPGEAVGADFGIAGGVGEAVLFEGGEIVGKLSEEDIISVLVKKTREYLKSGETKGMMSK